MDVLPFGWWSNIGGFRLLAPWICAEFVILLRASS